MNSGWKTTLKIIGFLSKGTVELLIMIDAWLLNWLVWVVTEDFFGAMVNLFSRAQFWNGEKASESILEMGAASLLMGGLR